MAQFFTEYRDAHAAALSLAKLLGRETGIEAAKEYTRATVRRHKAGPQSIELTGGHVVAWSCRTQRDAIILGELPYVGAAVLP